MSAYSASDEEALRARDLLEDWAGEGFITEAQYRRMEQEAVCELRRTNIFLRVVLFLFTLIIVGAAVALFFVVCLPNRATQTTGIFLLVFGVISYAASEFAVAWARLYRYGIEEALAACAVGFLCVGMEMAFFGGWLYSSRQDKMEFLVPACGAIVSIWMWSRFGLPYAPLAAMIFAAWIPGHWTSSHAAQRLIVAAIYAGGLIIVVAARSRYRLAHYNDKYSIVEALLWLGVYLAVNLRFSLSNLFTVLFGALSSTAELSGPFYWATWVLIWCLPPAALARGLRRKDRFLIAAGALMAVLTLVTNKPYLGWPQHTWDPMLLGALLTGVALFVRRWLAAGPDGIRQGFTARRLSGKDKEWVSTGSAAFGIISREAIASRPQAEFRFGGGDSGGGGATSDF